MYTLTEEQQTKVNEIRQYLSPVEKDLFTDKLHSLANHKNAANLTSAFLAKDIEGIKAALRQYKSKAKAATKKKQTALYDDIYLKVQTLSYDEMGRMIERLQSLQKSKIDEEIKYYEEQKNEAEARIEELKALKNK